MRRKGGGQMNFFNGMKFLFIGNSATYVHEIPQTLQRLAGELGYEFTVAQITPGGCELAMHANPETELGQRVFAEIAKGYDVVFIQENGSCMSSDEKRAACFDASKRLIDAIRASGAEPWIYVRPPTFKDYYGYSTLEQCVKFDEIFGEIARQNGGVSCVYVNRAFAQSAKTLDYDLWGKDRGHTSPLGAYLIVCTFFATLFGESATKLSANGIYPPAAKQLAEIADKIALPTP
ncbi:MAG: hypothetical protein IIW21_03790 [Clostridia bacterium]|nr:hypothetical protein [Clostridia bacterium]